MMFGIEVEREVPGKWNRMSQDRICRKGVFSVLDERPTQKM